MAQVRSGEDRSGKVRYRLLFPYRFQFTVTVPVVQAAGPKVCLHKAGMRQVGTSHAGTTQVGLIQNCVAEIGIAQIDGKHIGGVQVAPCHPCTLQFRSRKIGLTQVTAGKIQIGQVCKLQAGAPPAAILVQKAGMQRHDFIQLVLGQPRPGYRARIAAV